MSNKFYLILIAMVALGLGIFYLIQIGFYPVAVVNYRFLGAKDWNEAVVSAHHYPTKTEEAYASESFGGGEKNLLLKELRRATLDKLIVNALISKELEKRVGGELGGLVQNKIRDTRVNTPDFEKAVAELYGLTFEQFKNLVLIPQAEEEILTDRVKAEQQTDFSEWLTVERRAASVIILAPDLRWDGERVVSK